MVEKLGYEKTVFGDLIEYVKGNYVRFHIIEFDLKEKIVHPRSCYEAGNVSKGLTVAELKAIQQQIKELGW